VIVHEFPSGAWASSGASWHDRSPWEEARPWLLWRCVCRMPWLPTSASGPSIAIDPKWQGGPSRNRRHGGRSIARGEIRGPRVPINSGALAETAAHLLAIWKRVLKDPSVDADADFFRSGGDSLLAVDLSVEIERALGRPVPTSAVYRFSTPNELARWLDGLSSNDFEHLAPAIGLVWRWTRNAGLFFVPGVEGWGLMPKPLAEALRGSIVISIGLTFPKVSADSDPRLSVEEIAHSLAAEVRARLPARSLHFHRLFVRGLVAFELARQLTEAGESVENVILWDSYPVGALEHRSTLAAGARLMREVLSPGHWPRLRKKTAGCTAVRCWGNGSSAP